MSQSLVPDLDNSAKKLTGVQWLICIISAIGFAFDIYVLLMLPLILKPAMLSLGGLTPGTEKYADWARLLFFVPALVGGVFGLLGGYLTDLLGRRRILTFSILLYAVCTLASGYVTSLEWLLILRCGVFAGVCIEFVAAVAWLAELFPNPRQREAVLGTTQAFSSLGGVMIAGMAYVSATFAASFPAIRGSHEAWRYTLMSGVIPAIPLILIRPFLPESPAWQQKKAAGTLKRPSFAQLFSPRLMRTTILTTIVFASSYGIAFGAIQQLPHILAAREHGHKEIAAQVKEARDKVIAEAKAKGQKPDPAAVKSASMNAADRAVAKVQSWQEWGGLAGRIALAILALYVVSRRRLLRIFQIPALFIIPALFWWIGRTLESGSLSLTTIKIGIAIAGFFAVSQLSFWGNYIPLVFPLHLRGTGESFAANIGGRMLGTFAAFITLTLSAPAPGSPPNPARIATMAAIVGGGYALIGAICTQWLPEPREEPPHD